MPIILLDHEGVIIFIQLNIPLVIAVIVGLAGARSPDMGEVIKIKTLIQQFGLMNAGFTFWITVGKDIPVFPDGIIYPAHEGGKISIKNMEMMDTAMV